MENRLLITFHQFEHESGNLFSVYRWSLILIFVFPLEIDNDGVIEPDNDDPQEMGDENVEVSTLFPTAIDMENIGGSL